MLERALCEETFAQDMNMQTSPINQTLDSQFFPSLRLDRQLRLVMISALHTQSVNNTQGLGEKKKHRKKRVLHFHSISYH